MAKIPGLGSLPGLGEILGLVQQQTTVLLTLPDSFARMQATLDELARSVAKLTAALDGLDLDALRGQAGVALPEMRAAITRMDANLARITGRLDEATDALGQLPGVGRLAARRRSARPGEDGTAP